jgi:hypothetical protein
MGKTIKQVFVIVELDDGKMHQVLMDDTLASIISGVLVKYHNGKIKLIDKAIESIAIEKGEQ